MSSPVAVNTFGPWLKERYGCRVQRLCIDAGLGCPNRDGTLSDAGCTFCLEESYSRAAGRGDVPVADQIAREMELARSRGAEKFISYLQPGTNTHGSLDQLRRIYDDCTSHGDIVALAVGTRPDWLERDTIRLLASYATADRDVWVEMGLQSANDETLSGVNRNHTYADFEGALRRCRQAGLLVAAHLIIGLPGEGPDDWRRTAELVGGLCLDGVKIHQLQVVEGTPLAREYESGVFETLTAAEYVDGVCDILERLPAETVVMRLVGDTRGDSLVAPRWKESKAEVTAMIEAELAARGTRQGALGPKAG